MARTKQTCGNAYGGRAPRTSSRQRENSSNPDFADTDYSDTTSERPASSSLEITPTRPPHRVFGIMELLCRIFEHTAPPDLSVSARVCKRWSNLALDVLWEDVEDVTILFSLLAELEDDEFGKYDFIEPPAPSDWNRFQRYARRVRRLLCLDFPLSDYAVIQISEVQRDECLMPRLHTLHWGAPIQLIALFSSPEIKNLSLRHIEELGGHGVSLFLEDIPERMPYLKTLDVRSSIPLHEYEKSLVKLLGSLTRLEKVTLPRFYFTTKMAEVASTLPHLETVDFEYNADQGVGSPLDMQPFLPTLVEGAFPALRNLAITTDYNDATTFFSLRHAPCGLNSIFIGSNELGTPSAIHSFLSAIVAASPCLRKLGIVSPYGDGPIPASTNESQTSGGLGFSHLKPLLKLQFLSSLEIVHRHHLVINDTELEKLASSWPYMETLYLGEGPMSIEESNLTLKALSTCAAICPNLLQLGVFVDARRFDTGLVRGSSFRGSLMTFSAFRSLEILHAGYSIITEESFGAIVDFLAYLLPSGCTLDKGSGFGTEFHVDKTTSAEVSKRINLWGGVAESLSARN